LFINKKRFQFQYLKIKKIKKINVIKWFFYKWFLNATLIKKKNLLNTFFYHTMPF
jgi:hypothetical protein